MNGIYNPIVFYPTAFLIVLFAILTISFKNILYSLLSAILVFFLAGLLFYVLGSEYNAVIQIAIYGLAVPIILGLSIMFTNFGKEAKKELKTSNINYIMLFTAGVFILAFVYLVLMSLVMNAQSFDFSDNIGNTAIQVMRAFSEGIFVRYVFAFEFISIILTIIVVGIGLFDRREEK